MKDVTKLLLFGVLIFIIFFFVISPEFFTTLLAKSQNTIQNINVGLLESEPKLKINIVPEQANTQTLTQEQFTQQLGEPNFYQDTNGQKWVGIAEGTNLAGNGIFLCNGINEFGQQSNIVDSGNLIGLPQEYILKVLQGCGLQ